MSRSASFFLYIQPLCFSCISRVQGRNFSNRLGSLRKSNWDNFSNKYVRYFLQSNPLALAVSIILYAAALASAPFTAVQNSQFFLLCSIVHNRKNLSINAGEGKDLIEVTGGSSLTIDLESGQNTVTVSAAKDVTLSMNSNSDDRITLNWGTNRGLYTINATNNSSIATVDTLAINNAKVDSFTFQIEHNGYYSKNLLLTSTDGSKILIHYWADENNPTSADSQTCFTGIKFADGWQSFATINKKAGWV